MRARLQSRDGPPDPVLLPVEVLISSSPTSPQVQFMLTFGAFPVGRTSVLLRPVRTHRDPLVSSTDVLTRLTQALVQHLYKEGLTAEQQPLAPVREGQVPDSRETTCHGSAQLACVGQRGHRQAVQVNGLNQVGQ